MLTRSRRATERHTRDAPWTAGVRFAGDVRVGRRPAGHRGGDAGAAARRPGPQRRRAPDRRLVLHAPVRGLAVELAHLRQLGGLRRRGHRHAQGAGRRRGRRRPDRQHPPGPGGHGAGRRRGAPPPAPGRGRGGRQRALQGAVPRRRPGDARRRSSRATGPSLLVQRGRRQEPRQGRAGRRQPERGRRRSPTRRSPWPSASPRAGGPSCSCGEPTSPDGSSSPRRWRQSLCFTAAARRARDRRRALEVVGACLVAVGRRDLRRARRTPERGRRRRPGPATAHRAAGRVLERDARAERDRQGPHRPRRGDRAGGEPGRRQLGPAAVGRARPDGTGDAGRPPQEGLRRVRRRRGRHGRPGLAGRRGRAPRAGRRPSASSSSARSGSST